MKTNKKLGHCLMTLFWVMLLTTTAKAQVTIGDETPPKKFSLLEISTQNDEGGLRLPQLSTTQRDNLLLLKDATDFPAFLKGLVIYNTDNNCVEYWNNSKWISLCSGSSSITIINPAGKDPFDPANPVTAPGDKGSTVFPKEGDTKGPFTPSDKPACTKNPPFQILVISGAEYSKVKVTNQATGEFTLTMDENPTVRTRYAIVRVINNCTAEYRDFLFSQEAQDIGVNPDPTKPNVPAEGENRGPFTPEVNPETCTNPGTWTVTANQSWCIVSYDPATGAFSLQFSPNPSIYSRDVIITIKNNGCNKQAQYTITQNGNNIGINPDNTTPNTPANGGETAASTPEGNPTCTANPAYSLSLISGTAYTQLVILDVKTGSFSVKFDLNPSIYNRYAVVRIKDNCTGAYRDFTYTQDGQKIGVRPGITDQVVPAPGGQFGPYTPETNPEVCPNPTYIVTADKSWCKPVITDATTGAFYLVFEPNHLSTPRYANVVVLASNCGISAVYNVKQLGANVDIGIGNYPAPDVPATGGDTKQGIPDSEVRCDQTPAYVPTLISGKEYATLVVDDVALGIFHVNFSANPSTSSRQATIRVTNPCNGLYSDFVYTQLGSDCATKAITTNGSLSQSVEQGTTITEVTFNSLSPITVTGSSPGITISGRGSNTVTITGTPTTPGDYAIVASTGSAGCANESKTFLLTVTADACATLNAPTNTSGAGAIRCGAGEVNLAVTGAGAGENYRWYDASGNFVTEGVSSYNPTISTTTTFYVAKYNTLLGCETASTNRLAIIATVTTPPMVGTITKTSGNSLMKIGETTQLSITTTGGTWASSNTTVATVDNTGKVTAIAEGTTTITYTVSGNGDCAGTNAVATFGETIQVTKHCPVKISSTEYILMRCYNLGADESLDWRVPQKGLNGNYYQWGKTAPVATVDTPAGAIPGWTGITTSALSATTWTASAPDPCATLGNGWRLPTYAEINSIRNISTVIEYGPHNQIGCRSCGMNMYINEELVSYFPYAGSRADDLNGAAFTAADQSANYWVADNASANGASTFYVGYMLGTQPTKLNILNNKPKGYGWSIRCVKSL